MKTRDVIGRRIVSVDQERVWNGHLKRFSVVLYSLTLDNGARICLYAEETPECPWVTARVVKPEKLGKTKL